MPKQITSPSKRWPGHVILHDPLTLPLVFAIEEVQDKATEVEPSKFLQKINEGNDKPIGTTWSSKMDAIIIPAMLQCVSEWHLANFPEQPTVENFPASPRKEIRLLIDWIWEEINTIYIGEVEVPNES